MWTAAQWGRASGVERANRICIRWIGWIVIADRYADRESSCRPDSSWPVLGRVCGAELSLGLARKTGGRAAAGATQAGGSARAGVPDPAGRHLLVLARDPEGYRRLCQVISTAQLAGGEKGLPRYDEPALAD